MIEKSIQDYYDQMYELYPTIPKEDIRRILQYGWKSLYLHNSYGGDVLIKRKDFWFYTGLLMNNSIEWFNYYVKKMSVKLRVMYKRKQIPWDGFYYFALTENQYNEYLKQKNKKGRPRKNFTFSKVLLYKIYDECNISKHNCVAIFKIPMSMDFGMTHYKEELITSKAGCILVREPLKLNDILLSVYDYEYVSDLKRRYTKNKEINE